MNNSNSEKLVHQRLQRLHDSLPKKLPQIPKYLVELARNQKKLAEIREMKGEDRREMTQSEMKCQGITLESFKKALLELDVLHKKAVVELKSIDPKIAKLRQLQNSIA